jgi:hypothetical protein
MQYSRLATFGLSLALVVSALSMTSAIPISAKKLVENAPAAATGVPKDLGTLIDLTKLLPNTCPPEYIEKHPGAFDTHPNGLAKVDVQPLLKELGFTRLVGSAQGKTSPRWQTATLTEMKKDLSLLPVWLDPTKTLPEAEVTRLGSVNSTFVHLKWGNSAFTSLAGSDPVKENTNVDFSLTLMPAADAKAGTKKVLLMVCLVGNRNHISKTTLEVKSITIGEKEYPIAPQCLLSSSARCTVLGRGFQVPVQPGVAIKFNLSGTADGNNGFFGTWVALEE